MFRADLHCHSTFSDGTLTPIELLDLAKKQELSGLSITDHDTFDAYAVAVPAAKERGILLGTGIEFSCTHKAMSVHILGYDYLLDHAEIREFCQKHKKRRVERNRQILANLAKIGFLIREEELDKFGEKEKTVGRPHIAQLMVEKGYVPSIKDAFQSFLGEGKKCYAPGESFSVTDTIALIHRAKGKAFLAHPHMLEGAKRIRDLLSLPFDGIECHYAKFPPEKEKKWLDLAKEKKLLISGGSDYHGAMKDYITLGCSWVNEETFHRIFQNLP